MLFLLFLGLCALGIGAVIAHELLTRWRYDQALRTLIEGETVIYWAPPLPPERNARPPLNP
jgi:hypothetical protein